MDNYYLKVGKADDLKNWKDRAVYRSFEILPGVLSWGAIFLAFFLSWAEPLWVSVFIILFSFFWFFRTIYFSVHLWAGYKKMAEYEKTDWIKKLDNLSLKNHSLEINDWHDIYQLVVIPMYKEPLVVVRDCFNALLKTDYPKDKMMIVLACEEEAKKEMEATALGIEKEFKGRFFKLLITWHPANIAGEIMGKGSNETWAAKKSKELIVDPLKIPYKKVVFSSFDVDTCVYPKYFSCLLYQYLTVEKPTRTSFQPVPLFINNIWQAPVFSRIISFSSTFWHTMNQERAEKLITFSSHSMSLEPLVDIGFKQTNVVSDDSRIFWQCFLKYDGDYRVQPLYYPLSMDANVAKSFWQTLSNLYRQQRRWAYGVGDIPYFLFGFLKNKKIPLSKKLTLGFEMVEGHFSWAVASILIFLLGWLPTFLGGFDFSHSIISYNLSKTVGRVMTMAMVSIIASCYFSLILLPPKPPKDSRFKYFMFAISWILCPFIMVFFVSIPAFDAQTRWMLGKYMGFWATEKVRK